MHAKCRRDHICRLIFPKALRTSVFTREVLLQCGARVDLCHGLNDALGVRPQAGFIAISSLRGLDNGEVAHRQICTHRGKVGSVAMVEVALVRVFVHRAFGICATLCAAVIEVFVEEPCLGLVIAPGCLQLSFCGLVLRLHTAAHTHFKLAAASRSLVAVQAGVQLGEAAATTGTVQLITLTELTTIIRNIMKTLSRVLAQLVRC
mmetsp:Transcript_13483/g.18475  ORF Transcript_13483/g.18475 Transcript_13483/m.18475 type:complete len:205 (-) Transcript_13483:459-1073(-)